MSHAPPDRGPGPPGRPTRPTGAPMPAADPGVGTQRPAGLTRRGALGLWAAALVGPSAGPARADEAPSGDGNAPPAPPAPPAAPGPSPAPAPEALPESPSPERGEAPAPPAAVAPDFREISVEELQAAMAREQEQGYALTSIAHAGRLQSGVFLDLVRRLQHAGGETRRLRVSHTRWLDSYRAVTGLAWAQLPTFMLVPWQHQEDHLLDGRPGRVVQRVVAGAEPRLAVHVQAGWPGGAGLPPRYRYEDDSAGPTVEVIHERHHDYRLLDFGDWRACDAVRGVRGRALTGPLSLVFRLVGAADLLQTRFAFAEDGSQVMRTLARRGFSATQVHVIDARGRVLPAMPEDRPDLLALEARLQAPMRIEYPPDEDEADFPP